MMFRPTPKLKGKSAEEFHKNINDSEISKKQRKFLDYCKKLLNKSKV